MLSFAWRRRTFSVDSFVPLLVGLLDAEHNPDAMLLAARALTTLADVLPPARASIVHHGALPGTQPHTHNTHVGHHTTHTR
jgi:hypothetical protein